MSRLLNRARRRRRHPVLSSLAELDLAALRVLRTRGHGPVTDAAMKALGAAGEWGAVWAVGGVLAAARDRPQRGRWLTAAAIAPAAVGLNFAVKVAVGRRRPRLDGRPPLASAPSELSFPSAHATSSLAAATAMGRIAPAGRPMLYGLAAGICLSRPYLGMHYPSDVLAGAALGIALGRLTPSPSGDPRLASTGPETVVPAP